MSSITPQLNGAYYIMNLLSDYIVIDDADSVRKIFNKFPLTAMGTMANKLVALCINVCSNNNSKNSALVVLEVADNSNPNFVAVKTSTELLRLMQLDNPNFLIATAKLDYFTVMCELTDCAAGPETELACDRLYNYFGLLDFDTYVGVKCVTLRQGWYGNYTVLHAINKLIRRTSLITQSPWVKNIANYEELPTTEQLLLNLNDVGELVFKVPTALEYAVLVMNNSSRKGEELEQVGTEAADYYSQLSPDLRIEEAKRFFVSFNVDVLASDLDMYTILGPLNSMKQSDKGNSNLDLHTPCSKYGCRMLSCNEFGTTDREFLELTYGGYEQKISSYTWFKGACDNCYNRIVAPHHAVRRPMPDGGWDGTYCSWDCVRNRLCALGDATVKKLGVFESEMIDIGIQDRKVFRLGSKILWGGEEEEGEEESRG